VSYESENLSPSSMHDTRSRTRTRNTSVITCPRILFASVSPSSATRTRVLGAKEPGRRGLRELGHRLCRGGFVLRLYELWRWFTGRVRRRLQGPGRWGRSALLRHGNWSGRGRLLPL